MWCHFNEVSRNKRDYIDDSSRNSKQIWWQLIIVFNLHNWLSISHQNLMALSGSLMWCLTHWGRVTHICVGKLIIIIGSDNDLSPDRRQAIIWTNAGLLSIGPLRTYFSENLIKKQQLSLSKMHVKMSSAKWRPSCLNVLMRVMRTNKANWW